ncbi:putative lipase/esterase [Aspergillus carlsbadensis]|nr:putative lipase/esterase [Aspergillus carlsbadensis]
MTTPLSEWHTYQAETPKLLHDDPHRNPHFLSTCAGHSLQTGVVARDATVPTRDGFQIPIRVYAPAMKEGREHETGLEPGGGVDGEEGCYRGVMIFFHSGGFTGGGLETEDVSCRYMSLYTQTTVISVDYRLSTTHKYPVPINDGIDAFEYIAGHLFDILPGSELKFSARTPVKLILGGTSSGGHLAAIISQHVRGWLVEEGNRSVAESVSLVGVLLRAPVTVDAGDEELIPPRWRGVHTSWGERHEGADADRASMRHNHDSLAVPTLLKTSPRAYPLWGTFTGLPRTYIQICELDILRGDAVCYAQGLREAGVEVRKSFYENLPHIFWIYNHELAVAKAAQMDCVDGLRWLLGDEMRVSMGSN